MLDADELERRKPVWTAMSTLWLDTEISDIEIARIADTLIASGYPRAQLDDILLYEIAPVVGSNLLAPAGVWEGFDTAWLHQQARRRADHRSPWLRFWMWTPIGRALLTYAMKSEWQAVLRIVDQHAVDQHAVGQHARAGADTDVETSR